MTGIVKTNNQSITSIKLLKQINLFRIQESESTGKVRANLAHKTLLEIIRDEFEEEIDEQKILPISYTDSMNRKKTAYELSLPQAKQVLVRESKYVRKAMIAYIEKLENALKQQNQFQVPQSMSEALMLAANQALLIEQTQKQLQEQTPKAQYFDQVLSSKHTYCITQIAKEHGKTGVWLNAFLQTQGVQHKVGGQWVLYAKYDCKGYTDTETVMYRRSNGSTDSRMVTKWTERGRLFINKLIEANFYF